MDDRDALAQFLYTMRLSYRWQTWEETTAGQRQWCLATADQLIAQGWRRVEEGDVVVRHKTVDDIFLLTSLLCSNEERRKERISRDDYWNLVSGIRFDLKHGDHAALAPEPSNETR